MKSFSRSEIPVIISPTRAIFISQYTYIHSRCFPNRLRISLDQEHVFNRFGSEVTYEHFFKSKTKKDTTDELNDSEAKNSHRNNDDIRICML